MRALAAGSVPGVLAEVRKRSHSPGSFGPCAVTADEPDTASDGLHRRVVEGEHEVPPVLERHRWRTMVNRLDRPQFEEPGGTTSVLRNDCLRGSTASLPSEVRTDSDRSSLLA